MEWTPQDIAERLAGGPLVLDGATGTELERRGVEAHLPLWSAAALTEHPEVVEAIHRDYVLAGADIIVANTFRTNPRTLQRAGRLADGPFLNRRAIELARRAAAVALDPRRPVLVAASVGPVEDCYQPERVPEESVLRREHAEMMAWVQAAQPDLIWIETVGTVREARAGGQVAAATGLPWAVSFILRESGALLGGELLEDAVAAVEPLRPTAIGLNCIPPAGLAALLPRLRAATSLPLSAYGHVNNARPLPGWSHAQALSPAEYAAYARQWLDLGAWIVGGCCGTTPAYIHAVRALVDGR